MTSAKRGAITAVALAVLLYGFHLLGALAERSSGDPPQLYLLGLYVVLAANRRGGAPHFHASPRGVEMKSLAWMSLLVVATGCAQQWVRDGASAEDQQRDGAQCRAQGYSSAPPDGTVTSYITARAIEESCMKGKGWRLG